MPSEPSSPPSPEPSGSARLPDRPPSPLVGPLADNARLIKMISEILQLPADEVRELLYEEEMALGAYQRNDARRWGIQAGVWNDKLVEFYRHTNMGIFGNPVWNRRAEKLQLREWIGNLLARTTREPLDVLTIGDGSGFDSLYLAECGHRVTYSEESRTSIAFARQMFADAGATIRIVTDLTQAAAESFDAVVCLDVLEHVPDPPGFVGQLVRYLRPGGRLIVHAPFFFVGWLNPTHLASNRKYSGELRSLYEAHGLRLVDGRIWWDPIVLVKLGADRTGTSGSAAKRLLLRTTGLFLALGRWWNWPHCRVATKVMQQREPRWLDGLQPARPGAGPE